MTGSEQQKRTVREIDEDRQQRLTHGQAPYSGTQSLEPCELVDNGEETKDREDTSDPCEIHAFRAKPVVNLAEEANLQGAVEDAVNRQNETDLLWIKTKAAEFNGRRVEDRLNGAEADVYDSEESIVSCGDDHPRDKQAADRKRTGGVIVGDRCEPLRYICPSSGPFGRSTEKLAERQRI